MPRLYPFLSVSLPTWERGLKYADDNPLVNHANVAPYMGAWIEIENGRMNKRQKQVAPYMGAWIEIRM